MTDDSDDAAYERRNDAERASMREDDLRDEIERLREMHKNCYDLMQSRGDNVARLRAALERYRGQVDQYGVHSAADALTGGAEAKQPTNREDAAAGNVNAIRHIAYAEGYADGKRASEPATEGPSNALLFAGYLTAALPELHGVERDGLLAIVRKFAAHYPSGLNPWLDEAYCEALDFIRVADSATEER